MTELHVASVRFSEIVLVKWSPDVFRDTTSRTLASTTKILPLFDVFMPVHIAMCNVWVLDDGQREHDFPPAHLYGMMVLPYVAL